MQLTRKIQVKQIVHDREVIERLVDENIKGKLDSYLRHYESLDEGKLSVHVSGNKKKNFDGSISLDLGADSFRSERSDYKNLDDLVNHLFDHIKEQLSKKNRGGTGKIRAFFSRMFIREV